MAQERLRKSLNKIMSNRIRVKFKSFNEKLLTNVITEIQIIARRSGAVVVGPVPLPSKKRKFCVNRSPHIDKKSRDQYEQVIHKRLLYISNTTQLTMDQLMKMDISSGVKVDLKVG